MSIKDFSIFLRYQTHRDYPRFGRFAAKQALIYNLLSSVLVLIPIVNTVFGIVMLTMMEIRKKRGFRDPNRIPNIILVSFCITSLGFLLLPLKILGTVINHKEHNVQLSSRKIKEIPPDYLL